MQKQLKFDEFDVSTKEQWFDQITSDLKGKSITELTWIPEDGNQDFKVLPMYTPGDMSPLEYLSKFHRLQKSTFVTCVNYTSIKVGPESEANQMALEDISRGADGILFQVNNEFDSSILLNNLDVENVEISFETNSTNLALQLLQNNTVNSGKGFIKTDPIPLFEHLGNLRTSDKLFFPIQSSKVSDPIEELTQILELGLRLVNLGADYNLKAEELIRRFFVWTNLGPFFFLEIAKLRAIKILMYAFSSAYTEYKCNPYIFSLAESWANEAYTPHENMIKGPTSAMAAIIGGSSSVIITPENDENLTRRIALNTVNIIKEEAYVDNTIDPAAGAYFIENLTDILVKQSWQRFLKR